MNEYKLLGSVSRVFVTLFCLFVCGSLADYVFKQGIALFSVESPLVFPVLLVAAFITCLTADWIMDRKEKRKNEDENGGGLAAGVKKELAAALLFLIGTVLYILFLPRLHFVLGTIIFMAVFSYLMNNSEENAVKKILKSFAVSSAFLPLLYFIFYGIFRVALP